MMRDVSLRQNYSLARRRFTSFVAMERIESNSITIFTSTSAIFVVKAI
jgi:hypothetical protein